MDFEKHGRIGLLTLAMTLFAAMVLNVYYFGAQESDYSPAPWLPIANILNLVLLMFLCLVVFASRNVKWQMFGTVVFATLQFYGMSTVRSLPGTY